jgi:hypothetical protein
MPTSVATTAAMSHQPMRCDDVSVRSNVLMSTTNGNIRNGAGARFAATASSARSRTYAASTSSTCCAVIPNRSLRHGTQRECSRATPDHRHGPGTT